MRPYSVRDLAQRWACSRETVYSLIRSGELRAFRAGGKLLRITAAEVDRWENAGDPVSSDLMALDHSAGRPLPSGVTTKESTASDLGSRRAKATREANLLRSLMRERHYPPGPAPNAESDAKRTVNPKQAGQQSDEAGQLVMTSR